jgi:hypothetical protein
MVDENVTATGSVMPTTTTVKPELSPDAIRQLMQAPGRRSMPWARGFAVPAAKLGSGVRRLDYWRKLKLS